MGDFVQNTNVKSAVRPLASPIADIAAFDALVQSVITSNPFGCVAYMVGTTSHAPVEKVRETYSSRIVYTDVNAKNVGNNTGKYNTVAVFTAGSASLLAATDNNTAHGGTRPATSGPTRTPLPCGAGIQTARRTT